MCLTGGGGSSGSATLDRLMDKIPFGPKPKIVDLTSDRKLADKVCVPYTPSYALHHALSCSKCMHNIMHDVVHHLCCMYKIQCTYSAPWQCHTHRENIAAGSLSMQAVKDTACIEQHLPACCCWHDSTVVLLSSR